MVGVKVFAMKNIVMKQILVGRTFDIRTILPILRFYPISTSKAIFDLEKG